MSETKVSKRDQVLQLLEEGGYTREEIAEKLDMTVASVSSQFTYLRWMGHYISYDENKVLSLVTEEEYKEWLDEKAANRKTKSSTSAKSPQEQADALGKTLKTQAKQLSTWVVKKEKIERDLQDMPDDDELAELLAEANANIVLLEIKIKRNKAKAEALPEPADESAFENGDDDSDDDDELL